jgi:hypothetical protein
MATLGSLTTGRLRAAGFDNIAATHREMSYDTFTAPLDLLDIQPDQQERQPPATLKWRWRPHVAIKA